MSSHLNQEILMATESPDLKKMVCKTRREYSLPL